MDATVVIELKGSRGPSCDRAFQRERIQHSCCLVRDRTRSELGVFLGHHGIVCPRSCSTLKSETPFWTSQGAKVSRNV